MPRTARPLVRYCRRQGRPRPPPWGCHANLESLVLPLLRCLSFVELSWAVFLGWRHYDTGIGHHVSGLAVGIRIKTDRARFRNLYTGADDGAANPAVTANLHILHQYRVLYF